VSGSPAPAADSAQSTIYFTPFLGNRVSLYNGSAWAVTTFTERSVALAGLTTNLPYDVFLYLSAGTLTLEYVAWSSTSARSVALTLLDGVYVKSTDNTRLYLGTFRAASVNSVNDSAADRGVWNAFNRVPRPLRLKITTDSWTYTTAAFRQANADASNKVTVVVGLAEVMLQLHHQMMLANSTGGVFATVAIGEDSTTTPATEELHTGAQGAANANFPSSATLTKQPAIGIHDYNALELSTATGTTTWFGDNGGVSVQSGMSGWIQA